MNIGLIVNLIIWSIVIIQGIIIYNLNKFNKNGEIDISEPRIGVRL